ncbi:MAG: hypothetical protein CMJ59_15045 [Planctomycetaceae bacterium]|nr:hypothetical protein [Planctomycetaceae bacterium]
MESTGRVGHRPRKVRYGVRVVQGSLVAVCVAGLIGCSDAGAPPPVQRNTDQETSPAPRTAGDGDSQTPLAKPAAPTAEATEPSAPPEPPQVADQPDDRGKAPPAVENQSTLDNAAQTVAASHPTLVPKLHSAVSALRGESGRIQIVGRALSPDEESRLTDIGNALGYLDKAIQLLKSAPPPAPGSSDTDASTDAEALLDELIVLADAAVAQLQVVDRAMTESELNRARILLRVGDAARRAVGEIAQETTPAGVRPDLLDLLPD